MFQPRHRNTTANKILSKLRNKPTLKGDDGSLRPNRLSPVVELRCFGEAVRTVNVVLRTTRAPRPVLNRWQAFGFLSQRSSRCMACGHG